MTINEKIEFLKEQIKLYDESPKQLCEPVNSNKPHDLRNGFGRGWHCGRKMMLQNELKFLEQLKEKLENKYIKSHNFDISEEQAGAKEWYEVNLVEILGDTNGNS